MELPLFLVLFFLFFSLIVRMTRPARRVRRRKSTRTNTITDTTTGPKTRTRTRLSTPSPRRRRLIPPLSDALPPPSPSPSPLPPPPSSGGGGGVGVSGIDEPIIVLKFNVPSMESLLGEISIGMTYTVLITKLQIDYTERNLSDTGWSTKLFIGRPNGFDYRGSSFGVWMRTSLDHTIVVTINYDAVHAPKQLRNAQYFTTARKLLTQNGLPLDGTRGIAFELAFNLKDNMEPRFPTPFDVRATPLSLPLQLSVPYYPVGNLQDLKEGKVSIRQDLDGPHRIDVAEFDASQLWPQAITNARSEEVPTGMWPSRISLRGFVTESRYTPHFHVSLPVKSTSETIEGDFPIHATSLTLHWKKSVPPPPPP